MIDLFLQILLSVIVPGILLAYLNKALNAQGPKLVYYVSAANWFNNIVINPQPQQSNTSQVNQPLIPQTINLHAITIAIKNNGNKVAKNIDISHYQWPNHFQIVPYVNYEILPPGNDPKKIIRLKSLNPGETIWISYLFASIINQDTFIEYVRSEEVAGTRTNMILNRVFPVQINRLCAFLLILGVIFIGFIIWWLYLPFAQIINYLINFPR